MLPVAVNVPAAGSYNSAVLHHRLTFRSQTDERSPRQVADLDVSRPSRYPNANPLAVWRKAQVRASWASHLHISLWRQGRVARCALGIEDHRRSLLAGMQTHSKQLSFVTLSLRNRITCLY
jgi:hypothetical protein